MLSTLVFGSLGFWALLSLAFVLMIIAAEKDSGIGATLTIIGALTLLFFLGNRESMTGFLNYVLHHPFMVIGIAAGYFTLGTVWSVFKWRFFLINARNKAIEDRKHYHNMQITVPKVADHRSRILVWMTYWPFSSLWTIINDPVKKIFESIFEKISGRMQQMADGIFKPVMEQQQLANNLRDEQEQNERSGNGESRNRSMN